MQTQEFDEPTTGSNVAQGANLFRKAFGVSPEGVNWESLGPFEATVDPFQDGSVFVISAPGHLPGHINLLCQTGPKKFTYPGGDVFHDSRLLTGEKQIAIWEDGGHFSCIHLNKEEAERSIAKVRELKCMCEEHSYSLEVIAAHDSGWYDANKALCLR